MSWDNIRLLATDARAIGSFLGKKKRMSNRASFLHNLKTKKTPTPESVRGHLRWARLPESPTYGQKKLAMKSQRTTKKIN